MSLIIIVSSIACSQSACTRDRRRLALFETPAAFRQIRLVFTINTTFASRPATNQGCHEVWTFCAGIWMLSTLDSRGLAAFCHNNGPIDTLALLANLLTMYSSGIGPVMLTSVAEQPSLGRRVTLEPHVVTWILAQL